MFSDSKRLALLLSVMFAFTEILHSAAGRHVGHHRLGAQHSLPEVLLDSELHEMDKRARLARFPMSMSTSNRYEVIDPISIPDVVHDSIKRSLFSLIGPTFGPEMQMRNRYEVIDPISMPDVHDSIKRDNGNEVVEPVSLPDVIESAKRANRYGIIDPVSVGEIHDINKRSASNHRSRNGSRHQHQQQHSQHQSHEADDRLVQKSVENGSQ